MLSFRVAPLGLLAWLNDCAFAAQDSRSSGYDVKKGHCRLVQYFANGQPFASQARGVGGVGRCHPSAVAVLTCSMVLFHGRLNPRVNKEPLVIIMVRSSGIEVFVISVVSIKIVTSRAAGLETGHICDLPVVELNVHNGHLSIPVGIMHLGAWSEPCSPAHS